MISTLNPSQRRTLNQTEAIKEKYSRVGISIDPWSELELGDNAVISGTPESGIRYYEQALQLFRDTDCEFGIACSLEAVATSYSYIGRKEEAEKFAREAIRLSKKLEDKELEGDCKYLLGTILQKSDGGIPQAIKYFNESLDLLKKTGNSATIVKLLTMLAGIERHQGNFSEAESLLTESMDLAVSTIDDDLPVILLLLASVVREQGDFDRSKQLIDEGLVKSLEISKRTVHMHLLEEKGKWYLDMKNYPKAIELFESCVEYSREIVDIRSRWHFLHNLSVAHNKIGNKQKEEEYLKESIEIQRQLSSISGASLISLGLLEQDKGDLDLAEKLFVESLNLYRKDGNRPLEAVSLGNLGMVQQDKGNYLEAESFFTRSLQIEREVGNKRSESGSLINLADLMDIIGNQALAKSYRSQAVDIEISLKLPLIETHFFDDN